MEWAAFLRPFAMFVLATAVLYPARMGIEKYLKPGKFKNLLLSRDPVLMTYGVVVAYLLLLAIGSRY